MAIRIETKYGMLEADTAQELKEIMQTLHILDGSDITVENKATREIKFETKRNHSTFYKYLGDSKQAKMLKIIYVHHPDDATDADLRDGLGLDSNSALAGVMAGLSKRAKKSGLTINDIVQVEQSISDGQRTYYYKLTDKMMEAIQNTTK